MGRILPFVLAFALALFALVKLQQLSADEVPGRLPRVLWVAIILLLPILGPVIFLLATWVRRREGNSQQPQSFTDFNELRERLIRMQEEAQTARDYGNNEAALPNFRDLFTGRQPSRPEPKKEILGPDDDPEFLWKLERQMYLQKKQQEEAAAAENHADRAATPGESATTNTTETTAESGVKALPAGVGNHADRRDPQPLETTSEQGDAPRDTADPATAATEEEEPQQRKED